MAGHSKWAQIKHKKGAADQKRGFLFSRLIAAIAAAAKDGANPEFNPRLRTAIEKAKKEGVPRETIQRALRPGGARDEKKSEALLVEAYGPGGAALLLEAATDNRNRFIAEIKKLLADFGGKLAEPGSVTWAFTQTPGAEGPVWRANFFSPLPEEERARLLALVHALTSHPEVSGIYTNASKT